MHDIIQHLKKKVFCHGPPVLLGRFTFLSVCLCVINHTSIKHLEVTMPLNRGSIIPTCCLYLDRRKTFRRSRCFAPCRVRSHFSFCTGKPGVFLGGKLTKLTTLLNSLWRNHCGGYWPTLLYNIEASTHLFMHSSLNFSPQPRLG